MKHAIKIQLSKERVASNLESLSTSIRQEMHRRNVPPDSILVTGDLHSDHARAPP